MILLYRIWGGIDINGLFMVAILAANYFGSVILVPFVPLTEDRPLLPARAELEFALLLTTWDYCLA